MNNAANKSVEELFERIKAENESTGILPTAEIPFDASLRQLCECNTCGAFGRNYTCPPYVGEVNELIAKVKSFDNAIIFRHVYELEDSFDIEGMNEGGKHFSDLALHISKLAHEFFPDCLVLGAGGCHICERCGMLDNIPCRFPEKALSSIEAHGMQVSELAKQLGMKYISGQNTVTYFGAVLV